MFKYYVLILLVLLVACSTPETIRNTEENSQIHTIQGTSPIGVSLELNLLGSPSPKPIVSGTWSVSDSLWDGTYPIKWLVKQQGFVVDTIVIESEKSAVSDLSVNLQVDTVHLQFPPSFEMPETLNAIIFQNGFAIRQIKFETELNQKPNFLWVNNSSDTNLYCIGIAGLVGDTVRALAVKGGLYSFCSKSNVKKIEMVMDSSVLKMSDSCGWKYLDGFDYEAGLTRFPNGQIESFNGDYDSSYILWLDTGKYWVQAINYYTANKFFLVDSTTLDTLYRDSIPKDIGSFISDYGPMFHYGQKYSCGNIDSTLIYMESGRDTMNWNPKPFYVFKRKGEYYGLVGEKTCTYPNIAILNADVYKYSNNGQGQLLKSLGKNASHIRTTYKHNDGSYRDIVTDEKLPYILTYKRSGHIDRWNNSFFVKDNIFQFNYYSKEGLLEWVEPFLPEEGVVHTYTYLGFYDVAKDRFQFVESVVEREVEWAISKKDRCGITSYQEEGYLGWGPWVYDKVIPVIIE